MKIHYILLLVLGFFIQINTSAQKNELGLSKTNGEYGVTEQANFGFVAGYSGTKTNLIEMGVGYQPWEVEGNFVYYPFAGFLALYEFDPNRKLYGTSLNAWYLSGPLSGGLSINRYSDYTNATYGIKPMIGISILRIGIMYGYNIFLNGNKIANLNQHSFTIKYYYPIWHKKEKHDVSD